jgi:hypothetical protein
MGNASAREPRLAMTAMAKESCARLCCASHRGDVAPVDPSDSLVPRLERGGAGRVYLGIPRAGSTPGPKRL